MAKFIGNNLLLKLETPAGSGNFVAIGGAVEDTVTWNAEAVDTSDKSTNRWRELTSAGALTASINTTGFINDDTTFELMHDASKTDSILLYRFEWSDAVIMEGRFHIDSFEGSGAYNAVQGFTATFASDGVPMQGVIDTDFLQNEAGENLTTENNLLLQGNY